MSEIEDLKILKNRYTTKILWLCLSLVFVFLVPALLAVYFGRKLDLALNPGAENYTNIALFISFIFSWLIVIVYYKRMSKKIQAVDDKIKKAEILNNK